MRYIISYSQTGRDDIPLHYISGGINMNDYRNDPNNRYSTEYDAREQAPQQLYGQAQFDAYSRGASGEYTFKAKKKTPASKKILTGIIAVLCVAAIGTTSIVGYTLITGNNVIQSSDSESSSKKSQLTSAKTKSVGTFDEKRAFTGGLKRANMGFKLGCGAEYNKIYLEVGYQFGITNVCKDDDLSAHSNALFVNFGVNF